MHPGVVRPNLVPRVLKKQNPGTRLVAKQPDFFSWENKWFSSSQLPGNIMGLLIRAMFVALVSQVN